MEYELLGRGLRALDVRADRRPREARSSPARTGFIRDMPAVGLVGSTNQRHARHYLQLLGLGSWVLGSPLHGTTTLVVPRS